MSVFEQVVIDYAKDRPIIFSTFQPDAAVLVRKLQSTYPVSIFAFLVWKKFYGVEPVTLLFCLILTKTGVFWCRFSFWLMEVVKSMKIWEETPWRKPWNSVWRTGWKELSLRLKGYLEILEQLPRSRSQIFLF